MLPLGAVPEPCSTVVTGIAHDSRQVQPGDLYAAIPGATTHGARFVGEAVGRGAAAVLTDPDGAELVGGLLAGDAGGGSGREVPVVVVDHPRAWMGDVAAAVYGYPARDLCMLGVTGTNGKTTTTYMLEAGMRHAGWSTGLIGTVETRIDDETLPSVRTTPEATDIHAILAVMRERGIGACVMEVSSHALAFGRVDGIVFDVAGFTNLSQDHLDFHSDLDEYFATKARLFRSHRAERAVVCIDDEYGRMLASWIDIPGSVILTTPAPTGNEPDASPSGGRELAGEIALPRWSVHGRGAGLCLVTPGGRSLPLHVPLPGDFNVANAALAVAMLVEAGIDPQLAVSGVASCAGVPGRMEQVGADIPGAPLAVVDYAHTPDAIQNVLRALRDRRAASGGERDDRPEHHGDGGRLIAVVGAGGDRDRDKRRAMGAAAAAEADVVIVTDDNPRSEEPAVIRAAVLAGAEEMSREKRADLVEVAGRRAAIEAALARARGAEDTVVLLGKGHEQGQEIAGTVHPFDDREVLREELNRWRR
ncbi:UDP-N-acetylmuramoyl-L-alanyl-D-glutamate--2,6-diaminopimelate ligase [Actinobacteria bacterium YIM 96077]|uniref:UDP-N-acetylmuramoyl-L-alanyl-D-glutamate--2,6-diaminopimelate ligase n=2 Tax=Phytoactinopolyspora halophila TaxID=1981511 RepID=A0A329QW72_9ACTN|nr:UDP-N-acetylmuramoyl-L-alanyl-D-glutamate--2,6-diaminopimelate ligase [Actinobacteria bacterium YIM 96077]RAW16507.1 UDP-N-acetylmuramoyl-L-alanyl-D-glutamate--2,6-diaminopimelate ligase [Phytoactinopolyspora halophila]